MAWQKKGTKKKKKGSIGAISATGGVCGLVHTLKKHRGRVGEGYKNFLKKTHGIEGSMLIGAWRSHHVGAAANRKGTRDCP